MDPATKPSNLMTRTAIVPDAAPTEPDLLSRVRAGDTEAYAGLYDRYRHDALRLAVSVAGHSRADDLVAEAFTQILQLLLSGRGPEREFRAYLFTVIRNGQVSAIRKDHRLMHVEDFTGLDHDQVEMSPWPELAENQLVARALATLPQRWQEVIRLATVEEKPLGEVAEILGINPNAVAQLSFRAREGLRLAYLAQHVPEPEAADCRATIPLLARNAREQSRSPRGRVMSHLNSCSPCQSARTEIAAVAGTF